MKTRLIALLGLSLAVCSPVPVSAQNEQKFAEDFKKAVEFGDKNRADRTLRNNITPALNYFQQLCWSARAGTGDVQGTMSAMKESWARVYGSPRTLADCEAWISGITQSVQDRLYKNEQAQFQLYQALEAARKSQDKAAFEEVRDKGIQIAEIFANLGHIPRAANTWLWVSAASAEMPEKTVQNRRDAIFALRQFLEVRDRWQYNQDTAYAANKGLVASLESKLKEVIAEDEARKDAGFTGEEKGVEAFLQPDAKEEVADLEFELLRKLDDDDVSPFGGMLPQLWNEVQFQDIKDREDIKKERTKLQWFTGQELFFVRNGASIALEVPGLDGTQDLAMSARPKPNLVYLGPDRTKPYGLFVWSGSDREVFFNYETNLAWTPDFAPTFYKSASSWKAKIGGEDVWFYDDDADGKLLENDAYSINRRMYSIGEAADGTLIPSLDSMRIGKKGKRVPFSEYAQIDGKWYHVRPLEDATKVGIRPLSPEFFQTGTIEYEWKGPKKAKPNIVVVQETQLFKTAFFDVTEGKVEVPVGQYKVVFGRIQSGKRAKLMQVQLFAGSMEAIEVKDGETTELVLGKDLALDWTRGGEGQMIEIESLKLHVKDSLGIHYGNLFNCTLAPEVVWSPKENAKGGRPVGKFVPVTTSEYVNTTAQRYAYLGRWVAAFPKPQGAAGGELTFATKLPSAEGWTALQELKNPLFGRLGLVWKQ